MRSLQSMSALIACGLLQAFRADAGVPDLCEILASDTPLTTKALTSATSLPCVSNNRKIGETACIQAFPLQSANATMIFDDLRAAISACVTDTKGIVRDKGVNHPDFYDAYAYDLKSRRVSLSIKDKSALEQTIVTLRIME